MKIIFIKKLIKENHVVKNEINVTTFDYIDKILIILSASGVSIISFTSIIGAPNGITSASLTLIFSLRTRIIKQLLNITRNKKNKHDKILMLAKSKLNSTKTLISQALIDINISYEEYKIMRLSSIKSKT